jgi:hypothetical protein
MCLRICGDWITVIHKESPTRWNNILTFYYSIFTLSSTCFRRHPAHHQEPKTALAVSGFSYVEGCWTCSWWTLSCTVCLTTSTWKNKILIHCCIFLNFLYELHYDARIQGHQVNYCSYNREISRMSNWTNDLLRRLPNYDNFPVAKTCRRLILAVNCTL